jgi:PAS domain S-box-containing protein
MIVRLARSQDGSPFGTGLSTEFLSMEKIPLDRLRLRFPDGLEQEFREDYYRKSLNQLRLGIIIGAMLYALFGLLDVWIFPEVKSKTWFVRFVIVLPACIAVFLFSLSPRFKKYMQITVFTVVLVAGAGINAMMVIVHSPVNYFHFAGLLLVIMYAYTFSKLRFLYTSLASWLMVVMYEIAALGILDTPLPVFLNDNFFYIAANLIGMFSSYHRELYIRKDFYQSRVMQALEKEKHHLEKVQLHETVERAIKSLRESEEKFRTLAETAAMGIFIHQGGNFLYANRAAEVIGGYTVDEYLTMNFLSLVHPDYLDLVKTRARERLGGNNEIPTQYEFKIVRKNGEQRWVLMTGGITDYAGTPAVIGTIIDITARRQAEEERYQMALLVENSSDFIGMSTLDGHVLFINSAGRKMVGLDHKDDVKKTTLGDYFMEEDLPALRDDLLPNDTWRGEFRLKHQKTGLPIPVDLYGFSVTDEKTGRPIARAAVIRDITDLKRTREERERYYQQLQKATQSLSESEARFRTLAETTTASIVIHRGGRFLYTNPAVQKSTGYTHDEFLNMEFWEIVHPDFRDLVRERGRARMQGTEEPTDYEFKIVTKYGTPRWVSTTAGIIEYEGSPAIIATLFDITDRKRAEEEKVQIYEERIAEEKRHLLEKEKILMDLHDGIGGITSNISILAELGQKATDLAAVNKTLATISRLSREGISEIRSFMHGLDTKELNWRTLAAELRNQGTSMLEPHNIAFVLESTVHDGNEQPGSLLWVNLFKIYKEALTNVIKHARTGAVKVVFEVSSQRLFLTVEDNGIGWDANRGNGRGLSNMKRRAEEIGGTMVVLSGRGTRIRVEIPLPIKYPESGIEL